MKKSWFFKESSGILIKQESNCGLSLTCRYSPADLLYPFQGRQVFEREIYFDISPTNSDFHLLIPMLSVENQKVKTEMSEKCYVAYHS